MEVWNRRIAQTVREWKEATNYGDLSDVEEEELTQTVRAIAEAAKKQGKDEIRAVWKALDAAAARPKYGVVQPEVQKMLEEHRGSYGEPLTRREQLRQVAGGSIGGALHLMAEGRRKALEQRRKELDEQAKKDASRGVKRTVRPYTSSTKKQEYFEGVEAEKETDTAKKQEYFEGVEAEKETDTAKKQEYFEEGEGVVGRSVVRSESPGSRKRLLRSTASFALAVASETLSRSPERFASGLRFDPKRVASFRRERATRMHVLRRGSLDDSALSPSATRLLASSGLLGGNRGGILFGGGGNGGGNGGDAGVGHPHKTDEVGLPGQDPRDVAPGLRMSGTGNATSARKTAVMAAKTARAAAEAMRRRAEAEKRAGGGARAEKKRRERRAKEIAMAARKFDELQRKRDLERRNQAWQTLPFEYEMSHEEEEEGNNILFGGGGSGGNGGRNPHKTDEDVDSSVFSGGDDVIITNNSNSQKDDRSRKRTVYEAARYAARLVYRRPRQPSKRSDTERREMEECSFRPQINPVPRYLRAQGRLGTSKLPPEARIRRSPESHMRSFAVREETLLSEERAWARSVEPTAAGMVLSESLQQRLRSLEGDIDAVRVEETGESEEEEEEDVLSGGESESESESESDEEGMEMMETSGPMQTTPLPLADTNPQSIPSRQPSGWVIRDGPPTEAPPPAGYEEAILRMRKGTLRRLQSERDRSMRLRDSDDAVKSLVAQHEAALHLHPSAPSVTSDTSSLVPEPYSVPPIPLPSYTTSTKKYAPTSVLAHLHTTPSSINLHHSSPGSVTSTVSKAKSTSSQHTGSSPSPAQRIAARAARRAEYEAAAAERRRERMEEEEQKRQEAQRQRQEQDRQRRLEKAQQERTKYYAGTQLSSGGVSSSSSPQKLFSGGVSSSSSPQKLFSGGVSSSSSPKQHSYTSKHLKKPTSVDAIRVARDIARQVPFTSPITTQHLSSGGVSSPSPSSSSSPPSQNITPKERLTAWGEAAGKIAQLLSTEQTPSPPHSSSSPRQQSHPSFSPRAPGLDTLGLAPSPFDPPSFQEEEPPKPLPEPHPPQKTEPHPPHKTEPHPPQKTEPHPPQKTEPHPPQKTEPHPQLVSMRSASTLSSVNSTSPDAGGRYAERLSDKYHKDRQRQQLVAKRSMRLAREEQAALQALDQ